jgi:hypothetical protein
MMADDVRADFYASIETMEQMSARSGVARRALPMLFLLRERIRQSTAETTPTTLTPASTDNNALLDMLFSM